MLTAKMISPYISELSVKFTYGVSQLRLPDAQHKPHELLESLSHWRSNSRFIAASAFAALGSAIRFFIS